MTLLSPFVPNLSAYVCNQGLRPRTMGVECPKPKGDKKCEPSWRVQRDCWAWRA
jgi:hypothetical protein